MCMSQGLFYNQSIDPRELSYDMKGSWLQQAPLRLVFLYDYKQGLFLTQHVDIHFYAHRLRGRFYCLL
ncbi:hypothetical protein L484_011070 [Morus notabilis]|uniref:Uncharacterized protein n=1 Tax=Morus notabilis TaxID=981085 RepID=W9RGF6_9ROSA|nr:hypothetical protein L484_011070 [Morus notabilis]